MLKVVDQNQIPDSDWDSYVKAHPYGTIFHSREIYQAYIKVPELRPFVLFCVDTTNKIRGIALAYYHSIHTGFFAPLTRRIVLMNTPISDDSESLSLLLAHLKKKTKAKAIYLEIRNHYDVTSRLNTYSQKGFDFDQHLNILVDLRKDEEQLWKDVSASRRREIKKAMKDEFVFLVESSEAQNELYPILQEIYSRASLPLFSRDYFNSLLSLGSVHSQVLSIKHDNVIVGAVLVLKYKKTIYGLFGGSKEEFFTKRPNDLLFWSIILWAKQMGYETFDWMGAGHPDKPYGVREWKKQFGGDFVNYGRFYYYHNRLLFKAAAKVFSIVKKRVYKRNTKSL